MCIIIIHLMHLYITIVYHYLYSITVASEKNWMKLVEMEEKCEIILTVFGFA